LVRRQSGKLRRQSGQNGRNIFDLETFKVVGGADA